MSISLAPTPTLRAVSPSYLFDPLLHSGFTPPHSGSISPLNSRTVSPRTSFQDNILNTSFPIPSSPIPEFAEILPPPNLLHPLPTHTNVTRNNKYLSELKPLSRIVQACNRCKLKKTKCTDDTPCDPCVKAKETECIKEKEFQAQTPAKRRRKVPKKKTTDLKQPAYKKHSAYTSDDSIRERVRLACQACKIAKVKCSSESPCKRCVKNNQICYKSTIESSPETLSALGPHTS